MREKFTTQLACGCTDEVKAEVARHATSEGLSLSDYVRVAVIRENRRRAQEAADAA